ncbi:MAG: DUF2235 domain-containing protein [Thiolinea sp.]
MKKLIVCCDGTWQSISNKHPSNVVKLIQTITPQDQQGNPQIVYYCSGIGAESSTIGRYIAGAFGVGLDNDILNAYHFLCMNYEPGDEIYMFGFSRGAYTVRSLSGLIYSCSLLKREWIHYSWQAYEFYRHKENKTYREHSDTLTLRDRQIAWADVIQQNVTIKFLGCWDTVGAMGIPDMIPGFPIDDLWNKGYEFHDQELSMIIKHARHALAIDEHRTIFNHTPMKLSNAARREGLDLQEKWFIGDHSAVGGGSEENRGLSDIALDWMIETCESCPDSIQFDRSALSHPIEPDPFAPFEDKVLNIFNILPHFHREIPLTPDVLHESVIQRIKEADDYQPDNVRPIIPTLFY